MASIEELNKQIKDLKAQYKVSKNELDKLEILKKLEIAKKNVKALSLYEVKDQVKEEPKKKEEVKTPEVKVEKKEDVVEDMNRGKVAEPGSSIPESNKQEDKKHQKNNRN